MSESEVSMVNMVMSMSSPSPTNSLAATTLGQTLATCNKTGARRKREAEERNGQSKAGTENETDNVRKKRSATCPPLPSTLQVDSMCYTIMAIGADNADEARRRCETDFSGWRSDLVEVSNPDVYHSFRDNVAG